MELIIKNKNMEQRKIYEIKQRRFQIKHSGDYSKNNSSLSNIQHRNRPIDLKSFNTISNKAIPPSRNQDSFGISIRNNSHIFISKDTKTRNENIKNFNEIQNKSSHCLRRNNTNKNFNNYKTQQRTLNIDKNPFKNMHNLNNQSQKINSRIERKKVQTPKYNTNEIEVNNLKYYIKCPYCHHTLNDIPKNEFNNRRILYQRKENELENSNPNIKKNNWGKIYDSYNGENKIIKNNKFGRRSFYVNEKGVTVFKPPETSSIIIEKIFKPNYSRYHRDSITYGKRNNNIFYEAPAPKKTVIIRPIFN